MSDFVTMARTARESLARGLNALQADPNIPQPLQDLAAPIAQAMGALHQIERSGGTQLQPHSQTALTNVQGALGALQAQPSTHPAVATAMEAVAGALAGVHAIARGAAAAPAPAPAAVAPPQAQPQPQYAQPAPQYQAPPAAANPYAQPAPQYAPPPAQPQYAQQPPQQAPQGVSPFAPTAAGPPGGYAQAPAQVPPAGDAPVHTAELGAHSPSNFYKGLSGNDIVDHGGVFVSTYKIPKLGSRVRLKVTMPGGYEFEANGVVRWRREANDASTDAPPGFGAQFTDITQEARQLVYRYVRNREPMFHDDL